jgi:hypothetical protein
MTFVTKEDILLAVVAVAAVTLLITVEHRPVVHLNENPYAACLAEADQSPELKKIGVPVSAACLGF